MIIPRGGSLCSSSTWRSPITAGQERNIRPQRTGQLLSLRSWPAVIALVEVDEEHRRVPEPAPELARPRSSETCPSGEDNSLRSSGVSVRVPHADHRQDRVQERVKPPSQQLGGFVDPLRLWFLRPSGGRMSVDTVPARSDSGVICRVSTRRTAVRLIQTVTGWPAGLRQGAALRSLAPRPRRLPARLCPARLTTPGVGRPAGPALGLYTSNAATAGQRWCW
jgi:hypothetical protein